MKLTVETLNAEVQQTIVLDVQLDYEIIYVKHMIQKRTNIAFDNQALLADGQVLCDKSRLIDCDFIGDRTIQLLLIDQYLIRSPLVEQFQVVVKTLTGKSFHLNVRPRDSVKDVKLKIEEQEGIPPEHETLIFKGNPLDKSPADEERVLFTCGVREGSVIHLVLRLRAGPCPPYYDLRFRTLTGKTIAMSGKDETVKDAIERVWKLEGIQAGDELTFNNEPLSSEKKMTTANRPQYLKHFPDAYKFQSDSILEFRNKPCTRSEDELKVYVKFPGCERKALALTVKASATVRSLKSAIDRETVGGRVKYLKLAGGDCELKDGLKLSVYAVENETVLCATLQLKLFVKRLDKPTIFRLEVQSDDRIENVKKRIQDQEQIPIDEQTLSLEASTLEDHELVDSVCYWLLQYDRITPVFGLEVKRVRDLQIRISPNPWPFDLGTSGIGRPISVSIKNNETVRKVKSRIASEINSLPDQQHLFFNGEQLVDSWTFDQLGFRDRVNLCFAQRSDLFKISIVPIGSDQFEVKVGAHDTIKYVKSIIEQSTSCSRSRSRFPFDRQILIHEGKQLEDDRTLLSYRIEAGSELGVSLRVVELAVTVQTEFVERRVVNVRSDCTWEMFVSKIKQLDLSICSKNDCSGFHGDLSKLIVREPLLIKQRAFCKRCSGCSKIKIFKLITGWN